MKEPPIFQVTRAILILLIIWVVQYFTKEPLRIYSNYLTPKLQQYPNLVFYLQYPTFFGNTSAKHIVVAATFAFANNYCLLIVTFMGSFSQFLDNSEKLFFTEPRPYWYNKNIVPYDCEESYGFPSNHTFGAAMLFFFFFRIIEHICFNGSTIVRYFFNCLWVFLVLTAVISRMAMGLHSLDQLVFGLVHGSYVIYLFYYEIGMRPDDTEWLRKFLSFPHRYRLSLWVCLGLSLSVASMSEGTFRSEWKDSIELYCELTEFPFERCFCNLGCWFGVLGAYLAVTLRYRETNSVFEQYDVECSYYTTINEVHRTILLRNKFYWFNLLVRFALAWLQIQLIFYVESVGLSLSDNIINRFLFTYTFSRFFISFIGLQYFSKQAKYLNIS